MPAILATNGFGGSKADFEELAPAYAKRGYVFLAYSGLGLRRQRLQDHARRPRLGRQGGQPAHLVPRRHQGREGRDEDRLRRSKDGPGDPRVGMIGGSYGGQIQFAIAGIDPRLDTIVPQITWNDLSYSLGPNNTDFERGVTYRTPGVIKLDWPVLFSALGVGAGVPAGGAEPGPEPPRRLPELHRPGVPVARRRSRHRLPGRRDARAAAPRVGELVHVEDQDPDVPRPGPERHALQPAGGGRHLPGAARAGHAGEDALALVRALRRRASTARATRTNLETAYESRLALQWFDYYLRGRRRRPALDFSFLRDWVEYKGDAAPAVGVTPTVPGRAPTDTLFLSGTDQLVAGEARVGRAARTSPPSPAPPAAGGGVHATSRCPTRPGTFASYTRAPLAEDHRRRRHPAG